MRLRRFLTAFVCLSTLAFAQNVVAGTSMPDSKTVVMQAEKEYEASLEARIAVKVGGAVPTPSTMMLLVCGLAGLTAAGSRQSEEAEDFA